VRSVSKSGCKVRVDKKKHREPEYGVVESLWLEAVMVLAGVISLVLQILRGTMFVQEEFPRGCRGVRWLQ
jgi:hypothetical protein